MLDDEDKLWIERALEKKETKLSTMAKLTADHNNLPSNGWVNRHNTAVTGGGGYPILYKTPETPIVKMLTAWHEYALSHKAQFESSIGHDYVLGPAWQQIGESIRTLLNGDLGRLDGGTLDKFILTSMEENGVDTAAL